MLFLVAKYHVEDILAECRDAQHDDRLGGFNGPLRELIDLTSASRELGVNYSCEFRETENQSFSREPRGQNNTTY